MQLHREATVTICVQVVQEQRHAFEDMQAEREKVRISINKEQNLPNHHLDKIP